MNHVNSRVSVLSDTSRAPAPRHLPGNVTLRKARGFSIDPRLVCLSRPRSTAAESYSRLRLKLESLRQPDSGLVIGVTSPGKGDGKTLTAINLAGALAQDAKARILLIDLDLREPASSIRDYLDLKSLPDAGVIDWISNAGMTLEGVTRHVAGLNLHLVFSGDNADRPYELLKSPRLDTLLGQVRQHYDFVILDTTRVLQLPDTELISRLVDGFLIVVRANKTPRKMVEETLNVMTQEKVVGLVFNAVSITR